MSKLLSITILVFVLFTFTLAQNNVIYSSDTCMCNYLGKNYCCMHMSCTDNSTSDHVMYNIQACLQRVPTGTVMSSDSVSCTYACNSIFNQAALLFAAICMFFSLSLWIIQFLLNLKRYIIHKFVTYKKKL